MSDFPRLDRLAAMQRSPLGTFSPLRRPSPVATQYKRQAEMYGQALRTLSRAARRGDAKAAMAAIDLRDKANAAGFSPGGIQRSEDVRGSIQTLENDMATETADMDSLDRLQRRFGNAGLSREPVNPNATVGAGRGAPLVRTTEFRPGRDGPTSSWDRNPAIPVPTEPRRPLSFTEQDAAASAQSERSGAFGSNLQRRRRWWDNR